MTPAGTDLSTRFVGRERELRQVHHLIKEAAAGGSRLIAVTGEAGIGKTTFCRRLASRAEHDGWRVALTCCWPDAPPLWPWPQVLDVLDGSGFAAGGSERFAGFTAVAEALRETGRDAPTLIVLDDAHVADSGTLLLARFLVKTLPTTPLVLVLACRDEPGGPPLDEAALVVRLGPFNVTETAAFLEGSGYERLSDGLLRAMHRITRGNPLFLRRASALGRPDEVCALSPGSVRAAVRQVAEGLDEPVRRLLGGAALLGHSVAVADAAVAVGLPASEVWSLLPAAEDAGLIEPIELDGFGFTHDVVREALLDALPVTERLGVHARMADMLQAGEVTDPAGLARYAHHAVSAAPRSRQDAARAVAACRAGAAAMLRGLSYERAAALLETARTIREQAQLGGPAAPLLVELAGAMLLCGRLTDARRLFDQAAEAAAREGDVDHLARAAIGLGGVWVDEHRTRIEWERVTGIQRRALAALPADESRLRARLTVRLAAEEVYQGAPVDPVLAALEEARRTGDGETLAEALSLCHHALLTPTYAHERLPLAEELIRVATGAGKGMLALMGLCWRTVDLFLLGDPLAERSLAELRERADFLTCKTIGYIVESIDVMLMIRAGRLDEAEAKASTCYELGEEVGDADALGYLGGHLIAIRWAQGREGDLLDLVAKVATSPTLVPAEFAFRATVACFTAAAGKHDEARTLLSRLVTFDLPESSTWLAGMAALAETSYLLGDADLARRVYPLLEPYAELPVMASLATVCLGSAWRPLGLAALAMGDPVRAADHLRRAVTATRLLGNRPVTAVTQANLAEALIATGERGQAADLLEEAAEAASGMGMHVRAEQWRAITHSEGTVRRDGRHWIFTLGPRGAVVPDMVGVTYLVTLLRNPGTPISALELATGDEPVSMAASARQPVLDEQAMAAYRQRARELVEEIAEADADRAEFLRTQLDALTAELRAATGRGGRRRSFADPGERARTAVRKAVKRAIDEITALDPVIGESIAATITTGSLCVYSPAPDVTWSC
jgi:tetratricopeptide (TPR) repeat protein